MNGVAQWRCARDMLTFQVSMSKIRQRLSSKHQEIAEKLSAMLSKSVKDQAQVSSSTLSNTMHCTLRVVKRDSLLTCYPP